MNANELPISLVKRGDGPFDIHPQYGQVYKRSKPSEHDYVIYQGQLYWLDDEDLVQVGGTKTIEVTIVVEEPLFRNRIVYKPNKALKSDSVSNSMVEVS